MENTSKFSEALAKFLSAAQAKVTAEYAGSINQRLLKTSPGAQKFVRVVALNVYDGEVQEHGSAYCFVEVSTGNVLKPKGYKTTETKNPRSNIYDSDFGASGVTAHGTVYLR